MAGESQQVFISYARSDAKRVGALVEGLRQLHCDAWLDQELTGGQAWWDAVLSQIRASSVVVVAVSPAALESVAVQREYEYGHAVGRPLLPVVVDRVRHETLPSLLAPLQVVDYRKPGTKNAFALAAALANLPAPQALPQPLPDPPPIPISYLSGLKEHSQAATLTMDEQFALIGRLKDALGRASEREAAQEVLRSLQNRNDLYQASFQEIKSLLSPQDRQEPSARPHEAPSARPRGSSTGEWDVNQIVKTSKSVQTVRHDRARADQLLTNAEHIARAITFEYSKALALADIARAQAAIDPDRADQLITEARSIAPSIAPDIIRDSYIASALADIAWAVAATDPDRAERIGKSIRYPGPRASALAYVAEAVAATDPDRAARLLTDAERIAQSITDKLASNIPAAIAKTVAATDPDRAERIGKSIRYPGPRASALAYVAEAVAATDRDRAARLLTDAERIAYSADKDTKDGALADVAEALAATDPDRAERIAQSITDKFFKAGVLADIAKALAATDPGRAARLLTDAERIAQSADTLRSRLRRFSFKPNALQSVAVAVAVTDPDRAERIANSITEGILCQKSEALAYVTKAVAATDPNHAERIANSITDGRYRASALASVAEALAVTGPD